MANSQKQYSRESFSMQLGNGLREKLHSMFGNFTDEVSRPAAFVASTVLYDEMKIRVPVAEGTLRDAIYRYRDKDDTANRAIFYVGPNKRKAPHWSLVEHGHFQLYAVYFDEEIKEWRTNTSHLLPTPVFVAAKPYIRPTYDAKIQVALDKGLQEMERRFQIKASKKSNKFF